MELFFTLYVLTEVCHFYFRIAFPISETIFFYIVAKHNNRCLKQ